MQRWDDARYDQEPTATATFLVWACSWLLGLPILLLLLAVVAAVSFAVLAAVGKVVGGVML